MGFYDDRILPHLVNLTMRNRRLVSYRERAISAAEGRVLEVGVGSGLNLPLYPARVREIVALGRHHGSSQCLEAWRVDCHCP